MKIRITRRCGIAGISHGIHEIVDVSDADGRYLIGISKAEPCGESVEQPKLMTTDVAAPLIRRNVAKRR